MPVKRVKGSLKKGKARTKPKLKRKTKRAEELQYPPLPTEPKEPVLDIARYVMLLYGREKIGKTTFLTSFPDIIFASTEPGTKGQRIYEYNSDNGGITTWEVFLALVELLERNPERFATVGIDTADRLYDLCLDYVCKKLNISHPGEDSAGEADFGKSWKEVRKEFLKAIDRIIKTGRGVVFTSHAKEHEIRTRSGDRYTRIFPSMSGQARSVIEALVDFFFYCEYARTQKGDPIRVICTQGDEVVWAGHRPIDAEKGIEIPRFIPLTKTGGYNIMKSAFDGKDIGLDTKTLMPSKTASDAIKKFVRKSVIEENKKETQKKLKKKKPRIRKKK